MNKKKKKKKKKKRVCVVVFVEGLSEQACAWVKGGLQLVEF